jgi:hypothetical protein
MISLLLFFTSVVSAEPALPPRAQELVGKYASFSGPNCWDSALYSAGLVTGIRHVDFSEFTAWLESPLCEEVGEKSAAAGDIVALRRARSDGRLVEFPYSAEIHGYLLLAPGMAFTKNGTSSGDGYQVQDTASLHANYEAVNRKDCRILGLPKELCGLKAQYFRCSPVSSLANSEPLKAIETRLVELESELHRLYTGELRPSSPEEEKARIKLAVDSLTEQLNAAAADDHGWQTELLRLRLVSARIFQF